MGQNLNANEPVAGDDADVEGHGLIRNAAIAAALTVGGGVVAASPAAAGPVEEAQKTTVAPAPWVPAPSSTQAVADYVLESYGVVVSAERVTQFMQATWPTDPCIIPSDVARVKAVGDALAATEGIVDNLTTLPPK